MKVSAAIMAHPERRPYVEQMIETLNRDVPVYWDPNGPPSGKGDRVWSVAREAWSLYDPAADWHVMLQDDAVPCTDLLEGLAYGLDHVPAHAVVSLYLGQGRVVPARWTRMAQQAEREGACFVVSETLMWGVGLALPTAAIPEMIAWCDRKAGMPDDMRVAAWARRTQRDVWYTWPSLVDHRAGIPSLTKHHARERVAQRHHQGSALEIGWQRAVVLDPMILLRRGPRSGPRSVSVTRVTP